MIKDEAFTLIKPLYNKPFLDLNLEDVMYKS